MKYTIKLIPFFLASAMLIVLFQNCGRGFSAAGVVENTSANFPSSSSDSNGNSSTPIIPPDISNSSPASSGSSSSPTPPSSSASQTIAIDYGSPSVVINEINLAAKQNLIVMPVLPGPDVYVFSYAVTPDLPLGIKLDSATGIISGASDSSVPSTEYTITANTNKGIGVRNLKISVNGNTAQTVFPTVYYNSNQLYGSVGTAAKWTPLINAGEAVSAYSLVPNALPYGLSFDPNTGIISGSPTQITPATKFTLVANTVSGTSNFEFTIQITGPLPQVSFIPSLILQQGVALQPVTPQVTSGISDINLYTLEKLPSGLTLDPKTGALSGTPNSVFYDKLKLVASGPNGSVVMSVNFNIQAQLPKIQSILNPQNCFYTSGLCTYVTDLGVYKSSSFFNANLTPDTINGLDGDIVFTYRYGTDYLYVSSQGSLFAPTGNKTYGPVSGYKKNVRTIYNCDSMGGPCILLNSGIMTAVKITSDSSGVYYFTNITLPSDLPSNISSFYVPNTSSAYFLLSDGTIKMHSWGATITKGNTDLGFNSATQMVSSVLNHFCAVHSDGIFRCLTPATKTTPTTIAPLENLPSVKKVVNNIWQYNCALTQAGSVYCWGTTTIYSTLGAPKQASCPNCKITTPVVVTGLDNSVTDMVVGDLRVCGLLNNKKVRCVSFAPLSTDNTQTFSGGTSVDLVGFDNIISMYADDACVYGLTATGTLKSSCQTIPSGGDMTKGIAGLINK